jgi:hypothetical protein
MYNVDRLVQQEVFDEFLVCKSLDGVNYHLVPLETLYQNLKCFVTNLVAHCNLHYPLSKYAKKGMLSLVSEVLSPSKTVVLTNQSQISLLSSGKVHIGIYGTLTGGDSEQIGGGDVGAASLGGDDNNVGSTTSLGGDYDDTITVMVDDNNNIAKRRIEGLE